MGEGVESLAISAPRFLPVLLALGATLIGCRNNGQSPPRPTDSPPGTPASSQRRAPIGAEGPGGDPQYMTPAGPSGERCPPFRPARSVGQVLAKDLRETSGLSPGKRNPSVLFSHNDSGDEARVYALSTGGDWLATFRLGHRPGRGVDVEDLAVASTAGKSYVYLADIGDNRRERKTVRIDRFVEPLVRAPAHPPTLAEETIVEDFDSVHLTYPEGPVDAEALLVDPLTGELVIIDKNLLGWPSIYLKDSFSSGQLSFRGQMTPERVGHALQYVTAADLSADGRFIGVRTYTDAFLFERSPDQSLVEALLQPGCRIPTADEIQGEALALIQVGTGHIPSFVTISEGDQPNIFSSLPDSGGDAELAAAPLDALSPAPPSGH